MADNLSGLDIAGAVDIKFIQSSGPGGQNVNKVATAAQLRFDPVVAGLTPYQINRLNNIAHLTRDGVLIITAREYRSQAQNKAEALNRLEILLSMAMAPPPKPRRATRPTKRAVEKRLEAKKHRGRSKAARQNSGDWGED